MDRWSLPADDCRLSRDIEVYGRFNTVFADDNNQGYMLAIVIP